jgi:AAT family amino acid transporter/D-serine/D-alanine/glycine transporter
MDDSSRRAEPVLAHGLTARHVQFIALGGAIGAGLFLGSGVAISRAGPALVIAYAAAGAVIFLMARALGELALFRPVSGAFSAYAHELLGRRVGFITGWSYWLMWVLVGTAEITGIGVFMRHWFPDMPQWIPALAAVGLLYTVNMTAVKSYGELEYWLALVKVVTIVGMLICGVMILVFGLGVAGQRAGVSNLWAYGGFFPHGWQGILDALPAALFAFGGLEIIGLTAAETERPEQSLPRAINGVAYRILIFYIGSLTMIMLLYPWNALDAARSPFILVLERIGFPAAAGVINFVVITALLSSCNSGIFGSSRMLHSLSSSASAPAWLQSLTARRVPGRSITACASMLLLGVALNYVMPDRIFGYLMAAVSALLLWTWAVIMLCHLAYRRRVARGEAAPVSFRLPGAPYTNWLVLTFIATVAVLLAMGSDTRLAYCTTAGWIGILLVADALMARRR